MVPFTAFRVTVYRLTALLSHRRYLPHMPFSLPPDRVEAARAFAATFHPGQRVCLTTHVNPDGDGLGSEAGLAHLLKARGVDVVVTNPTPTPPRFMFLFEDLPGVEKTGEAVKEIRRAPSTGEPDPPRCRGRRRRD